MKIDHIEVFVPSRQQAATWYGEVFGFEIVDAFRAWSASEGGPLMISNDGGETLIALFRGQPLGDSLPRGWRRLALRVDADAFLAFLDRSDRWRDEPLGPAQIQDHDRAISVYFPDPWGNLLEVTSYDPEPIRHRLGLA
ncbi:MAG: VOC family protein [Acidobacteriota bacterium]